MISHVVDKQHYYSALPDRVKVCQNVSFVHLTSHHSSNPEY